jgi:hypothetical protein
VEPEEVTVSIDPPLHNPAQAANPTPTPPGYPPLPPGRQPAPVWETPTSYSRSAYPMPPAPEPPPKKLWYAVAAFLIVVGLVVCGVGIGIVVNWLGTQPANDHTFRTGGSTTRHIDAVKRRWSTSPTPPRPGATGFIATPPVSAAMSN